MIKFSPLSEIIHALPVASAIKRHLPFSKIIWITDEPGIELLEKHADIDCLLGWKRHEWIRDFPYPHRTIPVIWELIQMMNRLRHNRIDTVLDLEESNVSAFLSKRIKASHRVRFDHVHLKKGWIRNAYTQLPQIPKWAVHDIERNLSILNAFGIDEPRIEAKISIPQESQNAADQFLQEKMPHPDGPLSSEKS